MFLHGSYMHIAGNLLFLWVFADNIEAVIGNLRFLLFYFGGGIAAGLAHVYLGSEASAAAVCCAPCEGCDSLPLCSGLIPSLGASGAISAVMGAYLLLFPASKVKVLVLIFFSSFYISAWVFLGLWFVQQLISGLGCTSTLAQQAESGVAWWAHIGGFVFGIAAALYFKNNTDVKAVILKEKQSDIL
jgi:membrane associated rhomboid family serine protease